MAATLRDICAAAAPRYVKPSAAAAASASGGNAEANAAAAVLLPAAAGRGRVAAARRKLLAAGLVRAWATDPGVRPAAAALLDTLGPDAASADRDGAALDGWLGYFTARGTLL